MGFQVFASKGYAALVFHRNLHCTSIRRSVWFSSISVWMGQGGSGPTTGGSGLMDNLAMYHRWQGLGDESMSVEWGAIGEIGLRRTIYGSRDVFAQFDLGQKLIGPADTQTLERAIMTGSQVPVFLGMAYLDSTWQNTLAGAEAGGTGLTGRATFADL